MKILSVIAVAVLLLIATISALADSELYFQNLDKNDSISVQCDQRNGKSLPIVTYHNESVVVLCGIAYNVYFPIIGR